MVGNVVARGAYATAPIAVWWDMNDCPIPEGYDATRVRPSLEEAFKSLGYTGPVSVTAYGDLKETSDHLLRRLTSTGVNVAQTIPGNISSVIFSDRLKWRAHNPPPATMMLISNQVEDVMSLDLVRLQQHTFYNLFVAYSLSSMDFSILCTSEEWLWDSLLDSANNMHETPRELICAMFYCKSCSFDCQSLKNFRKHISSRKHLLQEVRKTGYVELDPVTRMWGRNYPAKPEYATANIRVLWDMNDCPVPESCDARQVRSSLEGAFKSLGYTGPVSITAFVDQKLTPDHVLQGLSSTGVDVAYSIPERTSSYIFDGILQWRNRNPPPSTIMLISNQVEEAFSRALVQFQQPAEYNLFLAYSFRPYKMSPLVTCAEWLWDSLLAVSETRTQLLQKCSTSRESTGMFYCSLCRCDCKGLDNFRKHLLSNQHELREASIYSNIQLSKHDQELLLEMRVFPKSKPLGKASSRLTNRGARRKSQKC